MTVSTPVARMFSDEHAALYPEGHKPGEKYAVEPTVHPGGKQPALSAGPKTVWYPDVSALMNHVDRHDGAGEKTVVSAGGAVMLTGYHDRMQTDFPVAGDVFPIARVSCQVFSRTLVAGWLSQTCARSALQCLEALAFIETRLKLKVYVATGCH